MQESEVKGKDKDTINSIWTIIDKEESHYVHRCSVCGYFKKELRAHWFFTGLYCRACIQDLLYNNARTIEEVK